MYMNVEQQALRWTNVKPYMYTPVFGINTNAYTFISLKMEYIL